MRRICFVVAVIVAAASATTVELTWSVNVSIGSSYSPSAMIVVPDGTLVAQTVNATSETNTVTGIDAATGQRLFEVPDGSSDSTGRTGLAPGDATASPGLFFQEVNHMEPFQNAVKAYNATTGSTVWSFTNERLVYVGLPRPLAFKGNVYAGARSMFVIDANSGSQVANRSDGDDDFVASAGVGYSFTDASGAVTGVVVYPWITPTIAFNVTDPSNPTQLWSISKVMPGQGKLSNNPRVTPDGKTVFVQTASANATAEGLWIGALNSRTGALEPGFGTVNVDFSTAPFGVSNAALFATKTSGPSGALDIVAYSRATGHIMWLAQLSPTPGVGCSCVYDGRFDGTILCALITAETTKSPSATQLVVVDPHAGRVVWQHTFPATEGSMVAWTAFAPIPVARDEVVVMWRLPPDTTTSGAAQAAVRRLKLVNE